MKEFEVIPDHSGPPVFAPESATRERLVPCAVRQRPATHGQHAKELLGMPSDWEIYSWEQIGNHPNYWGLKVSGGVPRILTRGPRKGKKSWRSCAFDAAVTIRHEAHNAWLAAWEGDTGHCCDCEGTGQRVASWSRETGHEYKPCKRCDASGIAPIQNPPKPDDGGEADQLGSSGTTQND